MAVLDCRGMEPVGFDPRVGNILHCDIPCWRCPPLNSSWFLVVQAGWTALGAESGTKFDDIDLTEGDWADYDEKVMLSGTSFLPRPNRHTNLTDM